jgi:hypothetical protein
MVTHGPGTQATEYIPGQRDAFSIKGSLVQVQPPLPILKKRAFLIGRLFYYPEISSYYYFTKYLSYHKLTDKY